MKRLLFLAHRVPYPPDKGERVRAFEEIKALSAQYQITLACPSTRSQADQRAAQALGQWCHEVLLAPAGGWGGRWRAASAIAKGTSASVGYFASGAVRKILHNLAVRRPYDVAVAYCSSMLPLLERVHAAVRVLDMVDVDSAKWFAYADKSIPPMRWLYRREGRAVSAIEQRAVRVCDAVTLTTAAEAKLLHVSCPNIHALPNGVDLDHFSPPAQPNPAPSLVFTGTMNYRPNVEGVRWFVHKVWPLLRKNSDAVRLAIVGRDPVRAVRRLARQDGIMVTGTVADVRPFLARAGIAIAPLHIARGIQNKVLEAMATGCAVVASGQAIEGLDVTTGVDLLQAREPQEWCQCILGLYRDAEWRRSLQQAARRRVQSSYRWSERMAPLATLLEKLSQARDAALPHRTLVKPEILKTLEAAV